MQRLIRLSLFLSVLCFGSYSGVVGWMVIHERQFVYHPTRTLSATPETIGLTYEAVQLQTQDQVHLSGWFVPALEPRATVLLLHGNGGNISDVLDSIAVYHRLGLNMFAFDYRGYGASEGTPDEQGTYKDAEAAWRYLTDTRTIPPHTIIIVGHSLGGGVATWLAQHHPPAALVLQATFTSLPDVAAPQYPWIPVQLVSRIRYPSIDRIGSIQAPILIIHSRDDELIPYHHAEQLFAAAAQPKTLFAVHGDHNTSINLSDTHYEAGLDAFLHSIPLEHQIFDARSATAP